MEKSSDEFDKHGFLWKRISHVKDKKRRIGQKKWNFYYVHLIGGSLHYYKDAEDQEPKGTIELNKLKFDPNDNEGSTQKFCFSLKNDSFDYLFYCEEQSDWEEWTKSIIANMEKDPQPPMKKEKRKNKAQELAYRMKKGVGEKAASSHLGKKAIKSQTPDEVKDLINALKIVLEQESKSSKKPQEIEDNMFKIGIKCYFLVEGGKVKIEDLLEADRPLRQALETLIKCHNHAKYSRKVNQQLLSEKLELVQKNFLEVTEVMFKTLGPHMKTRNVDKIKETTEYLGNPQRLLTIFTDSAMDENVQILIDAAEHYTQFHFYADK